MENQFDGQLRLHVNFWLQSCSRDWDDRQQAMYSAFRRDIESGVRIEDRQVDLAMIGGPDLLRYLWHKHEGSSDYSIRKAIVENRLCPADLLVKALRDSDWEVRRIAVRRPETPEFLCREAAKREGNEAVLAAMQERLGDSFPKPMPAQHGVGLEGLGARGQGLGKVSASADDLMGGLSRREKPVAQGLAMARPGVSVRDVMGMREAGLAVVPFGENWEGADEAAREFEITRYLKGQGRPHPEDDGMLDEFLNGGEFQALYDEAVQNNYSLMDLDYWIHLTKIMGDIKFETAMGIAEVLDEKEGISVLELPLPGDRKSFDEKLGDAAQKSRENEYGAGKEVTDYVKD